MRADDLVEQVNIRFRRRELRRMREAREKLGLETTSDLVRAGTELIVTAALDDVPLARILAAGLLEVRDARIRDAITKPATPPADRRRPAVVGPELTEAEPPTPR